MNPPIQKHYEIRKAQNVFHNQTQHSSPLQIFAMDSACCARSETDLWPEMANVPRLESSILPLPPFIVNTPCLDSETSSYPAVINTCLILDIIAVLPKE